jgi:hypothetical protein
MPVNYHRPPPPGDQISVEYSTLVPDFDEYTFHALRPGLFAGDDVRSPRGDPILVTDITITECSIPISLEAGSCLGYFSLLPPELTKQIFPPVDVCSLLAFRKINRYTEAIVDSLKQFRLVASLPMLIHTVVLL